MDALMESMDRLHEQILQLTRQFDEGMQQITERLDREIQLADAAEKKYAS
jgi:hypothetical protein